MVPKTPDPFWPESVSWQPGSHLVRDIAGNLLIRLFPTKGKNGLGGPKSPFLVSLHVDTMGNWCSWGLGIPENLE